ncbi:hypothetical protein E6O75_ATG02174 [Venturia nashicola]|uniref:DUF7587 domain-containing protein n=1 Tax=Venturia nashicola TaxID=86259 RepID=A0A4Z1PIF3_9PEZI|nr:hypothetical protein E6O75_ATG02174 [Venturia nashicola]
MVLKKHRDLEASTEAKFTPAINTTTLRSASRPEPSGSTSNLNSINYNNEHITSEDELEIILSNIPQRTATPAVPQTPRRQTPQRSQNPKTSNAHFGLLTPPGSTSSNRIQKSVGKAVSKKKVSNLYDKLTTRRCHSWTADERRVLCVLKRFFAADILSFTAVLNKIFPKALVPFTTGMVNMQYTEIRAGKQCSVESDEVWSAVWDVSNFYTARQNFGSDLEKIEETASEIGMLLSSRLEDDLRNITYAESRKVALQNRPDKFREVPNAGKRMTGPRQAPPSPTIRQQSITEQASQPVARRRTMSLTAPAFIDGPAIRHAEIQPDGEVPTLLFRAFSDISAGVNGEEGFRAGQFMGRQNAVPPPLDPNDARFAWDASNHLSQSCEIASKIATPFVSLSPSLVWCVQRLYKMAGDEDSKKFAIIIGPLADAHTRLYKMSASMEWFAWGEIGQGAISTVIGRRYLENLAQASPAVGAVLRLDVLEKTTNMLKAREEFKAHPVQLDGRSGMAIGKICLLFGISFHSDQAVITELIFHILQGWAIAIDIEDTEALEQAFGTFIGQLEASDCSVVLASAISIMRPKMREAFYKAIQQAAQELLKENSTRPNQRRRAHRRVITVACEDEFIRYSVAVC